MNHKQHESLHILYLIDELRVRGGTEKHLYELATGMADAGFRVTVFSLADGEYAREFKDDAEIHYECLNVTRIYDAKGLMAIIKIAYYMRNHKVDIIQTFHTASDLAGPLAARLSLRHINVISSRRDLGYTKTSRHLAAQRYVNRFVDGILANSSAVKSSVICQEGYPDDQISIIHNGISVDPFMTDVLRRQQQRVLMGAGPQTILIGSVGNIRPVKGYDLLVEAAGIVCRENPDVKFCHVGEGELKERLVARCEELNIRQNVTFFGTTRDVPAFLSALDIYMQPSRSEGLSNAILEAMAAGLPVVATDVGGNPDLIEHGVTGVLIPGNDSAALATQLLELIRHPLLRKNLAEHAFNRVLEKFQIFSMLNNYVKYYRESC